MTPAARFEALEALLRGLDEAPPDAIVDARDLVAAGPDGPIVFVATRVAADRRETRLARLDRSGGVRIISDGPGDDCAPNWAPDGRRLAFLSDRRRRGWMQPYVLDADGVGEARALPEVPGTVETVAFSPDGRRLLVVAAEKDAAGEDRPTWSPRVTSSRRVSGRRTAWVIDLHSGGPAKQLAFGGLTTWGACWCGNDAVVAIVSPGVEEGAWYAAEIHHHRLEQDVTGRLYRPREQVGLLTAAPDGERVAFVDTYLSDRGIAAGTPSILEPRTGHAQVIDAGCDATHLAWIDSRFLFFTGVRGLELVAGHIDTQEGSVRELWSGLDWTCGAFNPAATPLDRDRFMMVAEHYAAPPRISRFADGRFTELCRFDHQAADWASLVGEIETVQWQGEDGLDLEGWLIRPPSPATGPGPLAVNAHGGPVWAHRPRWLGRSRTSACLAALGCASLWPNPRGSSGRGEAFAKLVRGDPGGSEVQDILTGVSALVRAGVADPARLGLVGGSHGGFLTAWIVCQTDMFAAAAALHPCTNWVSFHYTSSIAEFDEMLLGRPITGHEAHYMARSPVTYAHRVRTPTLVIGGSDDPFTPPGQAVEFYNALRWNGVETELVLYPGEGHGVQGIAAVADNTRRVTAWLGARLGLPCDESGAARCAVEAQIDDDQPTNADA